NFTGSFLLEVNTTGTSQNPKDINNNSITFDGSTVVLTAGAGGSSTAGNYVQIFAVGTLTFGTSTTGFALIADPQGVTPHNSALGLYLSISGSGLAVSVGAEMTITISGTTQTLAVATGALVISSSGFAASLSVTADFDDPSSLHLYGFHGTFTLQVNTTGVTQTVNSVTIPAGPNGSTSSTGS